jgi:hypothetical protein
VGAWLKGRSNEKDPAIKEATARFPPERPPPRDDEGFLVIAGEFPVSAASQRLGRKNVQFTQIYRLTAL